MLVTLLQGKTAAVAAPTAATDGVPLWKGDSQPLNPGEGLPRDIDEVSLVIDGTGTGALSITYAKLWGYVHTTSSRRIWTPLGTGVAADKGKLNLHYVAGVATYTIASVANDSLVHVERIRGFRECSRIALELGVFSGTDLTVRAVLAAYGAR